jgi:hypothetical protein
MKSKDPKEYWKNKGYNQDKKYPFYVTGKGTYHQINGESK